MDIPENSPAPYRIGILPIPGFPLMSFASTVEPFRAANLLAQAQLYDVQVIAKEKGRVEGGLFSAEAALDFQSAAALDLLLVIAGGDPLSFDDAETVRFLRRQAGRGVRMGGVSGGPVILVKAGLMRGHPMTVHWEHAEGLLELAPDLKLERSIFVIGRDRVTCAGGTAPLDLAHALIAERQGAVFAQRVSDWFLHTEIRPAAAPQRSGLAARLGTTNAAVQEAVVMMENHIAEPKSLAEIATEAGLSARQLNRLFQQSLGQTVMSFYRGLRAEKARNLLQNSSLNVAEIAAATGFANAGHLAAIYKDRYGASPSETRR